MSRKVKANKALRSNGGKEGIFMIPGDALLEIAKAYDYGAKKYDKHNWTKGLAWDEGIRASLDRHMLKWSTGENLDVESGLHHDIHIAWNAITLVAHRLREIGTDDRYVVIKKKGRRRAK